MRPVAYAKYGPLVIHLELARSDDSASSASSPSQHTIASEPPSYISDVSGPLSWPQLALGAMSVVIAIPEPLIASLDGALDGDWLLVDEDTHTVLGGLPALADQNDHDGIIHDGTPWTRPTLRERNIRNYFRGPHTRWSGQAELGEPQDEL